MIKKILAVPAVALAALGAAMAAGSGVAAHAAGFTDTSVQGSLFVLQHHLDTDAVDFSLGSGNRAGAVIVSGIKVDSVFTNPDNAVTYTLASPADVDGLTVAVTNLGSAQTGYAAGITVSGNLNNGADFPVATVLKIDVTDSYGDTVVLEAPVELGNNVVTKDTNGDDKLTVDTVYDLGIGDNNPDGSVTFTAKSTTDGALTFSEGNLPSGLVSGNPKLLPGTAAPGQYKDQTVTATDAAGATATGEFLLTVNGGATATAPVPVLSHGSAVSVSNNRENVYFDTSITTWVHFQIVGPGAINGHEGWVLATAGALNVGSYSGLEAGHTYAVFYTPVTGNRSTTQIVGTSTGHVTFITADKK